MALKVNILDIIRGTTVDGPGFRTSIYFAGCHHSCPGCHNPESWNFDAGIPYSIDQLMEIIEEEDFDVTLSGGDPLYHHEFVRDLCLRIHEIGKNVWVYTGFTWEEILVTPVLFDLLPFIDILVDSPFILSRKNPDLLFRGSDNQRIIDVKASLSDPDHSIRPFKDQK